ncbi:MAG: UTP--glucose-1-phosphate uridylyltransferase [Candidatus Margulisiibacteriota bacterium]
MSSILMVGQTRPSLAKRTPAISYGRRPLHQVIWNRSEEQRIVHLPTDYEYLLQGRDGTPWHRMSEEWQAQRFADLAKIPWDTTDDVRGLVGNPRSTKIRPEQVSFIDQAEIPTLTALSAEGKHEQLGELLIRSGRLARITVAGGEAARFRNPGDLRPKALIEITDEGPLASETYLSIMAHDHLLTQQRFQPASPIPWLLFVSATMRQAFEDYFKQHNYFGLDPDSVALFENTAYVPKFRRDGRIALMADMDGGNNQDDQIAFYTSGHGALVQAYRENPVFIRGHRYNQTPHAFLSQRDVRLIFQSNIDNLGARTSTRGYSIILGHYAAKEEEASVRMLVELTRPLIGIRPDGSKFFWDEGGVALKVDGVPTIVDGNALAESVLQQTRNPEKPFPFNTANATYGTESIPSGVKLPDLIQVRNGLSQLDRNFWNLAGIIDTTFVEVPRFLPDRLNELPPTKVGQPFSRLAPFAETTGPIDGDNRFIPVKQWGHRRQAASLFVYITRYNHDLLLDRVKGTTRVLIVDDSDNFRENTADLLRSDGWTSVTTAGSRETALALLAEQDFDLVMLDSILEPEDQQQEMTGGVSILRGLKEDPEARNHGARVVFWSGQESVEASKGLSVFQTQRYEGVEYVKKESVLPNQLTDFLAKLLLGE